MNRLTRSDVLLSTFWTGWRRLAAWLICIGSLLLLGTLRAATDAELAFASFALLPVLAIAWIAGKRNGLLIAFLAAGMWAVGDIASGRQHTAAWIPWANAVTRFLTYGLVALLAGQLRLQFELEYERATHDPLTGLQNRRVFLEAGSEEIDRSKRYSHPIGVIFLDLDDFKKLNDTRGHDAGDQALCRAAEALRAALRTSDRVARLGGDEFAVLLPETGYDAAVEAGRKASVAMNAALAEYPPVTASVGVAWFAAADRSFPEMIKAADQLMYEVKASGKGRMLSRRMAAMLEAT